MAMFGGPFMPGLQAAMMGRVPGAILEGLDPQVLAALGAPIAASGEFGIGRPEAAIGGNPIPPPVGPARPDAPFAEGSAPPRNSFFVNGRSTEQPIDHMSGINAALQRNDAIEPPRPKGKGFKDFLRTFAGSLGDSLTGNPVYANSLQHERRLEEARLEAEVKARMPQQVGSSIIVPDGQGGYKTLFRDPSTPEAYAQAQGLQPGTEQYAEAVRQYRLGSWNDEAVAARAGLSGYNFDRRGELQKDRQAHSERMLEDRQTHSDAQLDSRLNVTRRGQNMTNARVRQPKPTQLGSEGAIYADILRRYNAGEPINARETAFARRHEALQERRARGSKGYGGGSDLVGPVYQRGNRRIQYNKKAGGYVDLATGQRVK